jgi:hypothetical protein
MENPRRVPVTRSHLKNRILVQGQGGAEFKPAGILKYVEDLKREPNAEIGPKDIFEIASKYPALISSGSGSFSSKSAHLTAIMKSVFELPPEAAAPVPAIWVLRPYPRTT